MCEHHKVEQPVAIFVLRVKKLRSVGYISLELRPQQHIGVHIVGVRRLLVAYCIAYRQREVTPVSYRLAVFTAYLDSHLFIWREACRLGTCAIGSDIQLYSTAVTCLQGVMDNEKVSFGKRCYAVGKDYRAVYTLAQAILGKGETLVTVRCGELPVVTHSTTVEHYETKFLITGHIVAYVNGNILAVVLHIHYNTLFFGLWQVEPVPLLLTVAAGHSDLGAVFCLLFRSKHKRTFSHVLGRGFK